MDTISLRNSVGVIEQLGRKLEPDRWSNREKPRLSSQKGSSLRAYLIGMEDASAPTHAGMLELCPFSGSHITTSFSNEVGMPSCVSRYIFKRSFSILVRDMMIDNIAEGAARKSFRLLRCIRLRCFHL